MNGFKKSSRAIEMLLRERECYFFTLEAAGGARIFENFRLAGVVTDTFLEFRGRNRLFIYAFVVMPDHAHLLFSPIGKRTHSGLVESLTQEIERRLSEVVPSSLLAPIEPKLRPIATAEYFEACRRYIEEDPVDEGLATAPESYPFTSRNGKFPCDFYEEA
jgi:REP element-mobilizing transposase RayT